MSAIDNDLDIRNPNPRKMICTQSTDNVWKSGGDYKHELIVGKTYELEQIDVHSDFTLLKIKGFDNWFNSVLFTEAQDAQAK